MLNPDLLTTDLLAHYLRAHLTGSAGGIELFSRGEDLADPEARRVISAIRDELRAEREQQLRMARDLDIRPAPLTSVVAAVGEKVGRLKPNGHPFKRTALTDVVDLESMRIALGGKLAGWESLLAVADQHEGLRGEELQQLIDQARRQHDQVSELHRQAAVRALSA